MTELSARTPAEIDMEIFANLQAAWTAEDMVARVLASLHAYVGDKKVYGWGRGERQGRWQMTDEQVIDKSRQSSDVHTQESLGRYDERVKTVQEAYAANHPLHAEYDRRGGWTRAYLVDNADGHVHNTTACPTWNKGNYATRYHWLTELSGKPETEIVELAGERACTMCYPTAPVDVLKRPSKLEGPAQAAAREAAVKRAEEKAARDAAKAAKAINNPDGSPLRGKYGVINTERTAWTELVDDLFCAKHYGYTEHPEVNARIVAALAAKNDITAEAVVAEVNKKMAAKAKREGRG